MENINWWETANSLQELIALKNEFTEKEIAEKNAYYDDLLKDRFVTEDEYNVGKADNEASRVTFKLEDFLAKYELTDDSTPSAEAIEKICSELGCPKDVVVGMYKEDKGESMSSNETPAELTIEAVEEEAPKAKRRGRPPGSVNKNKLAKDTDKLAMTVAQASSMVNLDGETLMDVARNLRDLANTFEKLSGRKKAQ